ncbi:exo-alpha-sialidase [Paenibacillus allorhizosphaerae]|uniref:exo-alpha-sialidase n=1 Tax=Paenibacillus allorhizosphaerae TaxID=2849866 RepID=A0ABM8VJE8_9BACL|nr:sialidase family protein [Paenibacillus allorhizosphaerae]CAG7645390.1 Sialidase [Paenibacillus allorhizosphaerae]
MKELMPMNKLRETVPPYAQTTVWAPGEGDVMTHMVFGLAVSMKGTILAFAEARIHYADHGPHHLVLKRSTDGGATWEAAQRIEMSEDGECWANPTALSDRVTGKLFVFYALNAHNVSTRMFFKVSSDDGLTWSERTEVTGLLQQSNRYGWTLFLPGPGHGLQLRDGRLVLQYWARKDIALPAAERCYGNGVLYSDNHGATWQAGGVVPLVPELGNNESRLVELESGALLLNARVNGLRHRVISVSSDRGLTWSQPYSDTAFPARWGCDSGLASWSGQEPASGAPVWLYSTIKGKRPDPDNALEVSISYDEGASWTTQKDVFRGPCNYSDVAVMPDSIVVLIGAGAYELSPGFAKEVVLVRMSFDWLVRTNTENYI